MTVEDAILEKLRHLALADQEKVLHFADSLAKKPEVKKVPYRDRSREMQWIVENRAAYADQFVALDGDCVIAAGTDAREVYDAARAKGIETPFIAHIVLEDPLPFGGW